MEKKALKYFIILLLIPLTISLLIAIFRGTNQKPINNAYDSIDGTVEHNNLTYEEEVKGSNTFVYLSVFSLVIIGVGVWIYVKKKGNV